MVRSSARAGVIRITLRFRIPFEPASGTGRFKVVPSRPTKMTRQRHMLGMFLAVLFSGCHFTTAAQSQTAPEHPIVLHAARLLDVKNGRMVKPGEVLVQGDRIVEVGPSVKHPSGAEVVDLGDHTLMPGLIDAHIHLFLHPGAEDLQTVQESVPQRTITATLAARDDLM